MDRSNHRDWSQVGDLRQAFYVCGFLRRLDLWRLGLPFAFSGGTFAGFGWSAGDATTTRSRNANSEFSAWSLAICPTCHDRNRQRRRELALGNQPLAIGYRRSAIFNRGSHAAKATPSPGCSGYRWGPDIDGLHFLMGFTTEAGAETGGSGQAPGHGGGAPGGGVEDLPGKPERSVTGKVQLIG